MSFAEALWASLAQTYSLPDRTALMGEGNPAQLEQQQDAVFLQPGAPYPQHHLYYSQQAQHRLQVEYSRWQLHDSQSYPQATAQSSFHITRSAYQQAGVQQYTNAHSFGYSAGYPAGNQQQYGYLPSTAYLSPTWAPPNRTPCTPLETTEHNDQALSIHWSQGYPSRWLHGGDAYGYWQAQQPQKQQAQPQCGWPSRHEDLAEQQTQSNYTQQATTYQDTPTHGSYLSPTGVPFDLHSSGSQVQLAHTSAEPSSGYPVYTGPKGGSHKAFYGAYEPLWEESGSEARPSFETRTGTMEPESAHLTYDEDAIKVDRDTERALVRYSPEPSLSQARPYRGRQENEYLEWDEQYGFGIAVPKPDVKSEPSNHPPEAHRGGPADQRQANGPQRSNTSPVTSYRARFEVEEEYRDGQPSSSQDSLLTRIHGRYERGLQRDETAREGRPSTTRDPPSQPWNSAFHGVRESRTLRFRSKRQKASHSSQKHIQLLEHSVDSDGSLYTTTQEVHSRSTITTCHLRRTYVPVSQQVLGEGVSVSAKNDHVEFSRLVGLAEGSPLANKPQTLNVQKECDERKPQAAQRQTARNRIAPNDSEKLRSKTEPTKIHEKNITTADTFRIYHRSMTNFSSPSPPTKHTKGESTACSGLEQADATIEANTKTPTAQATGGWRNFAAYIAQDDKNMAVKAREDLKRLGGETFRPEFRETYKDQKGKKQTVVHNKIGGSANEVTAVKSKGKGKSVMNEEEETGGDAVVVSAYDTDSSDGGVALSPSDLETDSWVVIKTGDEGKGWQRK